MNHSSHPTIFSNSLKPALYCLTQALNLKKTTYTFIIIESNRRYYVRKMLDFKGKTIISHFSVIKLTFHEEFNYSFFSEKVLIQKLTYSVEFTFSVTKKPLRVSALLSVILAQAVKSSAC